MFWLIKQSFLILPSFSGSLSTKCVLLNNDPYVVSDSLVDLNPIEHNYYLYLISLEKCRGSCNAADDFSTKICVPSKTKKMTVEVFNVIKK